MTLARTAKSFERIESRRAASGVGFWFFALTFSEICVALSFGGGTGQGLLSDAFVELCSLPLLVATVHQLCHRTVDPICKFAIAIVVVILALPLFQLLPLPPSIWTSMPGRQIFAQGFVTAGIALPWEPVSLDRSATWLSFLSLLPAVTIFLALLCFDDRRRRSVLLLVVAFAFVNFLLGLAQVAGGLSSPLRLYTSIPSADPVGFFANRNHFACLLAISILFTVAWSLDAPRRKGEGPSVDLITVCLACPVLLLGTAISHSRAGLVIAFFASLMAGIFIWQHDRSRFSTRTARIVLGLAILGTFLVVFQFAFVGFSQRLKNENAFEDLRWAIAGVTVHLVAAEFPWGSGLGTFPTLYPIFEPITLASKLFINHAHDDWLEVASDSGVLGILVALAFVAWYIVASIRAWQTSTGSKMTMRVCSVVVFLLMAHSVVDYPLRTLCLMVVFAISAACMIPPLKRRIDV